MSEHMLNQLAVLEAVALRIVGVAGHFSKYSAMRHHSNVFVAVHAELPDKFHALPHPVGAILSQLYRVGEVILDLVQVEASNQLRRLLAAASHAFFQSLPHRRLKECSLPIYLFATQQAEVHMRIAFLFILYP